VRERLCDIFTGFAIFRKIVSLIMACFIETYIVLIAVYLSKACVKFHVDKLFSLIHFLFRRKI